MGDVSFDLTKNKRFLVVPYACAAIGAVAAVSMIAPVAPLAIAATIAGGIAAGGIGIPTALTGVIAAVSSVFVAGKTLLDMATKDRSSNARMYRVKEMKDKLKMFLFATLIIGANCAKAMFVTPVQAAGKAFKGIFQSKKKKNPPPASMDKAPSTFKDKTAAANFNTEASPPATAPERKNETPPPTPKL